eukprot:4023316-Prymnesium_polylepis.1
MPLSLAGNGVRWMPPKGGAEREAAATVAATVAFSVAHACGERPVPGDRTFLHTAAVRLYLAA